MAKRSKNREVNVFGVSFMDVLSNTVGGLAFLLIIVFLIMGQRQKEPIEIMTKKVPDACPGERYELALSARGGGGVYKWRVSDGKLPEGLELDAANGRIAGTPADNRLDSPKAVPFTVECEGRKKKTSDRKLEMTVQPVDRRMIPATPVKIICGDRLPEAMEQAPYPLALACEGGRPPYEWTVAEGGLPPGLSLSSSGRISGVPEKGEGEYQFKIAVAAGPWRAEKQVRLKVMKRVIPPDPVQIVCDDVLPQAMETEGYPLVLACRGGVAPYEWQVTGGMLPKGLAVDRAGKISGAPEKDARGKYAFDVTVKDGLNTVSRKTVGLTVVEMVEPPPLPPPLKILTDTLPDAVAGRVYRFFPAAEGGVPPYRWNVVSKPPLWLQSDDSGKSFSGKPGYDDIAALPLEFEVRDSASPKAAAARVKLPLNVIPPGRPAGPLELLTGALPEFRAKNNVSFSFAAKNGYPPYQWSCRGLESFPGLTFDRESGILHGTASGPASGKLTVTVLDAAGKQAAADFDLTVVPPFLPLGIRDAAPPVALAGLEYAIDLSVCGGHPPYRWAVAGGGLPEGLKLETETGRIAGVPLNPCDAAFSVRVTDASGTVAKSGRQMRLKVLSRKQRPVLKITTERLPLMVANQRYELSLACEGGLSPYQWRIDNAPPGLAIEQGRLTGVPKSPGRYPVTVSVVDSEGQQAKADLEAKVGRLWPWWWVTIAVAVALLCLLRTAFRRGPKPRITTERIPNARASCAYYVKLACEGGTHPCRWRIADGELPPGLELSEDGVIGGVPFEGQKVNNPIESRFTVEVRDARGRTDRREL